MPGKKIGSNFGSIGSKFGYSMSHYVFLRKLRIITLSLVISLFVGVYGLFGQSSSDTVRVMTYNILKYDGTERNSYLNTVVGSVDPDIIIVQEMETQSGVNSFATNVLDNSYNTISFHDGPDTDSHIFFKQNHIEFVSDNYLSTSLRDIAEYEIKIKSNQEVVYFYSLHLKASSGYDEEQQRLGQAQILRNRLNQHPVGTKFIVLGDFNIYYSDEPAFQKLIQPENDPDGQCYDPINRPGNWHSSSAFTDIHTQSTRNVNLPDGGSGGGLDDRFDMMLISDPLWQNIIVSSYTEYGNDGLHFNKSINEGTNGAVGSDMANALFYASDHLPLYCEFVFETTTTMDDITLQKPQETILFQNRPNPFNPVTKIAFNLTKPEYVTLTVYDVLGKKVTVLIDEFKKQGYHQIDFVASDLPGGVYFYQLKAGQYFQTRKFILLK